jgi:hypothetical protein
MNRNFIAAMVITMLFGTLNVNAQKSNNESGESGKLISYTETGSVKMIINKDMVDRFNSIEVDENYVTWNYLYSTYDWGTIQYIVGAYKNGEIDITSKDDVERIVYAYQKTLETLFNANIIAPIKDESKAPLTSEVLSE